jgi:hypothetical protein
MTGESCREALEKEIQERFPARENEEAFRCEVKSRIWKSKVVPLSMTDLPRYVRRYQQMMERRREQNRRATFSRRPWRGNPWR